MVAFLLSAILLLATSADAPAPPVAMVLIAKGGVTLERGKDKPRPLRAMDLLFSGDRLRVDNGEAQMVFLHDGRRERLKPKSQAMIGDKGCTPADAVERLEDAKLSSSNLESLRDLARGRGAVGVLRGDSPATPQVVMPMYGATVLLDRPTLTWTAVPKAEGYHVQLLSGREGRDERILWRAKTKEPHLAYPEKEKPLTFGLKYRWRVSSVLSEDKEERLVESKFLIATEGEVKELARLKPLAESKDSTELLLAAATYEAHGVHGEALRLYEKLAERFPDEANFQVALASYYERAGRLDKAKAAKERARKLGAVLPEK